MRIASLTFGVVRTLNLGNYESLRLESSVTIEPDGDDTTDSCRNQAMAEIRAGLTRQFDEFKKKAKQGAPT